MNYFPEVVFYECLWYFLMYFLKFKLNIFINPDCVTEQTNFCQQNSYRNFLELSSDTILILSEQKITICLQQDNTKVRKENNVNTDIFW